MGFFGKLFEKKVCAFCGKEIGLLGNRKLEDGNMCKECAQKLSPWFLERRTSTVAEIAAQLKYREDNQEKVKKFHPTRTFGEDMKIIFDEDAKQFIVSDERDFVKANADVLSYDEVTGCVLDVEEDQYEIMKEDKDGNDVSYQPKRYMKQFDFYITIQVNHPYFDEMRFKLNNETVEYEEKENVLNGLMNGLMGNQHREVQHYRTLQEEIKAIITQTREDVRAAKQPKQSIICSYCGATTIPDENGCCEYCGGKA